MRKPGPARPHSAGRVVAVCAAYAGLHSLLASQRVKRATRRVVGDAAHDGLYRLAFSVQAAGLAIWALRWFARQPDRELYRARGPAAWLLRGVQVGSAATLLSGVRVVGVGHFLGSAQGQAFAAGRTPPPTTEAQGPPIQADGSMDTRGPFRLMRHPENLTVGVLWAEPRMTVNRAALAAAFTVYMIVGAFHEERRQRAAYGAAYDRYTRAVPFLFPRLFRRRRSLAPGAPPRET